MNRGQLPTSVCMCVSVHVCVCVCVCLSGGNAYYVRRSPLDVSGQHYIYSV